VGEANEKIARFFGNPKSSILVSSEFWRPSSKGSALQRGVQLNSKALFWGRKIKVILFVVGRAQVRVGDVNKEVKQCYTKGEYTVLHPYYTIYYLRELK
jgi:hypothetical protein